MLLMEVHTLSEIQEFFHFPFTILWQERTYKNIKIVYDIANK
jgi:hypothetical protein